MTHSGKWAGVYLGVALTTLGALLLELSLTRIFSVVFYYHFAFLAISIALFGLGAGGVVSYAVADRKGGFFPKLGTVAALTGLAVLAALLYVLTRRGEPGYGTLALVYAFSALPFLGAGIVLSLAIAETIERVNRVYFADLIGAAGGCLLLIPLLDNLGGPNTVIAAAVVFASSSAVWYQLGGRRRARNLAAALSLALLGVIAMNARTAFIDVRYAKGKQLTNERFVQWNSFSRIALAQQPSGRLDIIIDADAATAIPRFDFDKLSPRDRETLLGQGPGVPYRLRPGAKTLVLGAGGGWDIARALASGSKDVTGVEINPIIADTIMRRRFPDFSRGLYYRPDVRIVIEDGRSFVRRSEEKYQVIQATLVDTWASTAAGAFALSENNLYTTDAFRDYLDRLTPDGLLVFTRWGFDPPRESLRLLSLAREALLAVGQPEPWRNIAVLREGDTDVLAGWGAADTVLVARRPFSSSDLERLRAAMRAGDLQAVYLPDAPLPGTFTAFLRSDDPRAFERRYRFNISPVDDNRPFFFYTVQPRDIWAFVTRAPRLSADYNINRAVPLLFALLLVSLAATAVMLALPRFVSHSRLPADRSVLRFLWFFLLIGAGYILVQIALVQRFVLFLGHPTYALTVIIFSMLVSSGVGSLLSRRIVSGSDRRLELVLAGIAVGVAVLAAALTPLLSSGVGLPLALKFLISALVIAPGGFLMGMPFPTGLTRLELRRSDSVRWAWALNAAASVLGSVAATVLAIHIGLRETLLAGGGMYLLALLSVRLTRQPATAPAAEPAPAELPAR
jgi:SAM-dependent methyltransferase